MTSQPDPKNPDTSASLPDGTYERTEVDLGDGEDTVDSSAVSASPGPSKVVVLRGARDRSLSVPYNVERERRRMDNLRANGWSFSSPPTEGDTKNGR